MLNEQKTDELHGVVQKMINAGESEDNIGLVIKRFSELHSEQPQPEKQDNIIGKTAGAFGKLNLGVGKGIIDTAVGISGLGERMLNKPYELLGLSESVGDKTSAEKLVPESIRKPEGTAENVGYGLEKIVEFLAPSSKIAKVEKGMSLLPKIGTEIASNIGIRSAQQGKFDEDAKTTAIVSAIFPVVGATLSKAKGVLKPIGQKIQDTVIRPNLRDIEDGFKIENLTKYGVGGSLKDTVAKTHINLNKLGEELQAKLKQNKDWQKANINLNNVYKETSKALLNKKYIGTNFGDIGSVKRILENQLLPEIKEQAGQRGVVGLLKATDIKRGAGTKGSWAYNRPEPDANAIEKVYTTFYNKLKIAIEKNAPQGVKEINKKMSDLIPISNAALRRLPVEQRNNIISLTDSIGLFSSMFDPRSLALIGANRLSKSGKFGQFLVNLAERTPKTGIGQRIFLNK